MRPRPPPESVQVPWLDLLTHRALLHEYLRSFRGRDDFVSRSASLKMSDRRDVAALERFAEEVFNVYVDVGREWLLTSAAVDHAVGRGLTGEAVLIALRSAGAISGAVFEDLDAIREARNSWQHGASFVPPAAVWRGVIDTERAIDRALAVLQRAFERIGYGLEISFPDLRAG